MQAAIRIARLSAPFAYHTMQDIEANRQRPREQELPHRHDFFTIIAVEEASGIHQIDFISYPIQDNTLYFISPEQIHHLETTPGTPLNGHAVMFGMDFLMQQGVSSSALNNMQLFFNCDESKPLNLEFSEMESLRLFFQKFGSELAADRSDKWEVLGAWLKLFLIECKRLREKKSIPAPKLEHRHSSIVRKFKNDVEQNFAQWRQVNDYAQAQNLSSNYLNEVIKAETGTSAKDFILNRLILEAKRLARYSDLSAKQIAFSLGYEDVAQFSKFFKKCVGLTFSEFKEQGQTV